MPDHFVSSVLDITPERLSQMGFSSMLLDLDNTLLPRGEDEIPADIRGWCESIVENDIGVCLVSNSWQGRIRQVAGDLGFHLVSKAVKPLPPAYFLGMRRLGSRPKDTVMVGDQFFTDVLGAKLIGMTSIMVLPLAEHDLPHTLMLRRVERVLLGDRQPTAVL